MVRKTPKTESLSVKLCRLHSPISSLTIFSRFSQIENLLRGINDLIALVKKLQNDIANQHADIKRLQSLIENCAGCQEPQNLRMDTCQYANPCFPGEQSIKFHLKSSCQKYLNKTIPGVTCHDTSTGMRCGRCPKGYIGDGESCRPGQTCDDRPCFP